MVVYVDSYPSKPITVFQEEFEMNMRLLGAQTIKDVVPDMIDASAIGTHVSPTPGDRLYDSNCEFSSFFFLSTLGSNSFLQMRACSMLALAPVHWRNYDVVTDDCIIQLDLQFILVYICLLIPTIPVNRREAYTPK